MLENDGIWKRLDVLILLATSTVESGRSISGTNRIVKICAIGLGLHNILIDTTGDIITIQYTKSTGETFIKKGKSNSIDAIDCDKMKKLELIAKDISNQKIDIAQARKEIHQCTKMDKPSWWILLGLTILAFCIALQVGGKFSTALFAGILHLIVAASGRIFANLNIPNLFSVTSQCILGGLCVAVGHYAGFLTWIEASVALAVSWMLLVPLALIIIAVLDFTNQQYIAGITHSSVITLAVCGLVLGGIITLSLGNHIIIPTSAEITLPVLPILLGLLFSVIGAAANAMANSGGKDLLLPAAIIGLLTASLNIVLLNVFDFSSMWATSITAVALGFGSELLSRKIAYPAPVLALMGVAGALLPGLIVYNGLVLQLIHKTGIPYFIQAGVICLCLGIGVTFGFLLASFIKSKYKKTQASFVNMNE